MIVENLADRKELNHSPNLGHIHALVQLREIRLAADAQAGKPEVSPKRKPGVKLKAKRGAKAKR